MTKCSSDPNAILECHAYSGETQPVESITVPDTHRLHRQRSRGRKLGLVVANRRQEKIPDTRQLGHFLAKCRGDLQRSLDVSCSTYVGAHSCVMDITAGPHHERVSPFCRSQLESHRIHAHGVIGTMAMNSIWLPIVADCLPDALMDGVNFSH